MAIFPLAPDQTIAPHFKCFCLWNLIHSQVVKITPVGTQLPQHDTFIWPMVQLIFVGGLALLATIINTLLLVSLMNIIIVLQVKKTSKTIY